MIKLTKTNRTVMPELKKFCKCNSYNQSPFLAELISHGRHTMYSNDDDLHANTAGIGYCPDCSFFYWHDADYENARFDFMRQQHNDVLDSYQLACPL